MLERTYFVAFKQLSIFSVLILFNILSEKYHSAVHTCLPNGVSALRKASMIASIKALCLNTLVRDRVQ